MDNTNNLLIYQSSAGSGKTYTLAKEYLKLALKGDYSFANILAVTFTNKATEEMKNRVLSFLVDLSEGKNELLREQLKKEDVEGDLKEKSRIVLHNILHNYSDFAISTIDSFFSQVLRSFAKELKLQQGYELELDNTTVLNELVDTLLDNSYKNKELSAYLMDIISDNIEEERSWNIEKQIKEIAKEIFKERYWEKRFLYEAVNPGNNINIGDSRESIKIFSKKTIKIKYDFENKMNNLSFEAERIMDEHSLQISDFYYGKTGFMNYLLSKIRNYNYEPFPRVRTALNNVNGWYSEKTDFKTRECIIAAYEAGFGKLLEEAVNIYDTEIRDYKTANAILRTGYIIGLFRDILEILKNYRSKNKILLQSDVANILLTLISENNSPFILEKTGLKFRNYLIDEFQDTSTFQWLNFLPLIINSLSEGNFSLVVGDVKQSIYRWRGGNMKLLLYRIYKDLQNFSSIIETKKLDINYRSGENIVKFNNRFFSSAPEKLLSRINDKEYVNTMLDSYKAESIEQKHIKESGYVNIKLIKSPVESDDTLHDIALVTLIDTIKEIKSNGFSLKDILILIRKNEEGNFVADTLSKNGYAVVSSDSLLIKNSKTVRLIIDILKYLTDNRNELAKTELLYNYCLLNPDKLKDLHSIFSDFSTHKNPVFKKVIPDDFFKDNTKTNIKPSLNNYSLYDVVEQIIQIFNLNSSSDAFLMKFLDSAHEFIKKYDSDVLSFLNWWEDNANDLSIAMPESNEAIRIMTIHKAKGLQGKVVIIPFANWRYDFNPQLDTLWVSATEPPFNLIPAFLVKANSELGNTHFAKDYNNEYILTLTDNMNLLYVAFTRAEERLYVIVPEKTRSNNIGKLIQNVVQNIEGVKIISDDEFEFGEKSQPLISSGKNDNIHYSKLVNHISNNFYSKILIKPRSRDLKLLTDEKFALKTNKGVLIHEVLSYMETISDLENALQIIINEGKINSDDAVILKTDIEKLIGLEKVKEWFAEGTDAKNETEILLTDGKVMRPDRVLIKDNNAVIIDYKTGNEKEEHKKQVNIYAEVLKQMKYGNIEKYLLYINEADIQKSKIVKID